MKPTLRWILAITAVLLLSGFIYWQYNKKSIVRAAVVNTIEKKSDGLYALSYNSSRIDELNGNASFFNIKLTADSQVTVADRPSVLFDVRIKELAIRGANIAGFIAGTRVETKTIEIIEPFIKITGTDNKPLSRQDTLEVYERILGDMKLVKADKIIITNGKVLISEKSTAPHTSINGLNVIINNFLIDSTGGYENVLAYFIKDAAVTVDTIAFRSAGVNSIFTNASYDAAKQHIKAASFQQTSGRGLKVTDMRDLSISGIATNAFIYRQKLEANELSSSGGNITIYNKKEGKKRLIQLDSSFFDRAVLQKIKIGKTRVTVYDDKEPYKPTILQNITFNATDIPAITSGNSARNVIANSKWIVTGDGVSYISDDKLYKHSLGNFVIDKGNSVIKMSGFSKMPVMSEHDFMKTRKVQQDLYELSFKNIEIAQVDVRTLLEDGVMNAGTLSVQPSVKIYTDRTLPPDAKDKTGDFPHQRLLAHENEISIRQVKVINGYLSYRETGALSGQTGQIFFDKITGTISNVSNQQENIRVAPVCVAALTSDFMGVSKFVTKWSFPLTAKDGSFTMSGRLAQIQGHVLNAALEPQGMASVKRGVINSLVFDVRGNEKGASIISTLLYRDLKLEVLKKESDENDLKKKSLISFFANLIIKGKNPDDGITRRNEHYEARVPTRSFFGLIWKSIFFSVKKTITGKSTVK